MMIRDKFILDEVARIETLWTEEKEGNKYVLVGKVRQDGKTDIEQRYEIGMVWG